VWRAVAAGDVENLCPSHRLQRKVARRRTASRGRRILANVRARREAGEDHENPFPAPTTLGWKPTCAHSQDPVPCTVLDPFCGSGTTGVVAPLLDAEARKLPCGAEAQKENACRNR